MKSLVLVILMLAVFVSCAKSSEDFSLISSSTNAFFSKGLMTVDGPLGENAFFGSVKLRTEVHFLSGDTICLELDSAHRISALFYTDRPGVMWQIFEVGSGPWCYAPLFIGTAGTVTTLQLFVYGVGEGERIELTPRLFIKQEGMQARSSLDGGVSLV